MSVRRPLCPLESSCPLAPLGAAVLGSFLELFRSFVSGGPGVTFDYGAHRQTQASCSWASRVQKTFALSVGCLLSVGWPFYPLGAFYPLGGSSGTRFFMFLRRREVAQDPTSLLFKKVKVATYLSKLSYVRTSPVMTARALLFFFGFSAVSASASSALLSHYFSRPPPQWGDSI